VEAANITPSQPRGAATPTARGRAPIIRDGNPFMPIAAGVEEVLDGEDNQILQHSFLEKQW
jgi:hypothetical protein